MLAEIAALGFTHAELSHGIRVTLVPGILRAVEEGVVQISSTHNFCPLPAGITQAAPNLYQPSSPSRGEREQWVRQTLRSIEFAAKVRARVLVCHLGSVAFFWFNPARKVRRYLRDKPEAGRTPDDAEYRSILGKALNKLRRRQPLFLERVRSSLVEVMTLATEKGVRLGLENREGFDELPLDGDWAELLTGFASDAPVGYWHDTGHADLKESMGVLRHQEHLAALAPRLLGWHLHDVSAGKDHQPIGAGRIDFKMISGFWRPGHLLTLELSPRVSVDDVRASKARIEALIA
ncbi:MAG: TIM barrel protein [Opitutaceae bacterium]|nr:TIM barrel protein [Opitutaceae bacterium]